MGRKKKRDNPQQLQQQSGGAIQNADAHYISNKKPKLDDNAHDAAKKKQQEESFLVKKYRPDRSFPAMEAFLKYTKAHRMLDASYVRWRIGSTAEKPFVFAARVGGVDLGWGRGKTRDHAIDCACRAAFHLVSAHGYRNFNLDDDCLMEAPVDLPPPPPPPMVPPPPPPPLPGSVPLPSPEPVLLTQQEAILATSAPPSTSISQATSLNKELMTGIDGDDAPNAMSVKVQLNVTTPKSQQLKGGLRLLFSPEDETNEENEWSMEERRASLARYLQFRVPP